MLIFPTVLTAPVVFIEGSGSEKYHQRFCRRPNCCRRCDISQENDFGWPPRQFYDRYAKLYNRLTHGYIVLNSAANSAAFISDKINISTNPAFPGNALTWPPYLSGWKTALQKKSNVLDCESVGTVYLLPASVYHNLLTNTNKPHFPTAFTEHFHVVHYAKHQLSMRV